MSSAAGSAPFSFTVQNTGSINQSLTITASGPCGTSPRPVLGIPADAGQPRGRWPPVRARPISTGIQWTLLDNTDLGDSGWVTWTVNCGEVAPPPSALE